MADPLERSVKRLESLRRLLTVTAVVLAVSILLLLTYYY